jgi:sarcosine oxidase subunit beta
VSATFHSDQASLRARPQVVIVGGGIVALATAFFLSRLGVRACIVERLPTPASLTSRRSGEGVRAQWGLGHNIAIARASIAFYREFQARIGVEGYSSGYRPIGYLYASRTEDGALRLRDRVALQRTNGLDDVDYLDASQLLRSFPLLSEEVTGAAFRAGDGVVDVSDVIAGYLAAIDADILLNAEVVSITPDGRDFHLRTTAGELESPIIVIANGARMPAMLEALDVTLPMRLARSSILHVKTAGIPFDHPATIDVDLGSFWRPDVGGARITASFRRALFLDSFTDDPVAEPDYLTHAIATVAPLVPRWRDLAPTIADSHTRHGTFAVSGDGAPVIGPIESVPGLYVNGAYGGHGIMMSPDGGRRLAEIIVGGGKPADNPFCPSRFSGGAMPPPEPMTVNTDDAPKETR